jgi:EmrB/QacA subfamily drug resistance transporter
VAEHQDASRRVLVEERRKRCVPRARHEAAGRCIVRRLTLGTEEIATAPTAQPPGLEPHVYRLGLVIVIGTFMSILDATVVNVALDTLSRELHTPLAQIQWVVTAYLLALAAIIPVTGWMARRFGARRIYLTSLALFTLGSALCGLAWSTESLIVFRVLQGIGGGMLVPVGQMILARAAGPDRIGRLMSVVGVPMLLGPVFGPMIGGAIVQNASWRWIFFVNVPIGIVAFFLAFRLLHPEPSEKAGALDRLGLVLLSSGVPALTYGLAEYGQHGRLVTRSWVTLVAGAFLCIAFVLHALHATRPLLDVHLFRRAAFSAASLTTFCIGAALFGSMILLPLFFQNVRGQGQFMTGLMMAPQGLGAALAMPVAGKLTDRIGGGILTVFGVTAILGGTIPFVYIGAHTPYGLIAAAMAARGVGLGFSMMPSMATAFKLLRPHEIADATPQLNVLQRIGGSMGTAILAVVLARSITEHLTAAGGAATPAQRLDLMAAGYQHTYWWAIVGTAVAIVPAVTLWWLERRRPFAAPSELAEGASGSIRVQA